jgi:hypothetical protein
MQAERFKFRQAYVCLGVPKAARNGPWQRFFVGLAMPDIDTCTRNHQTAQDGPEIGDFGKEQEAPKGRKSQTGVGIGGQHRGLALRKCPDQSQLPDRAGQRNHRHQSQAGHIRRLPFERHRKAEQDRANQSGVEKRRPDIFVGTDTACQQGVSRIADSGGQGQQGRKAEHVTAGSHDDHRPK